MYTIKNLEEIWKTWKKFCKTSGKPVDNYIDKLWFVFSTQGNKTRRSLASELERRVMCMDGAMGTMIQNLKLKEADFRGERFKNHPVQLNGNNELLSITQPEIIFNIHKSFLDSGCDFVETNTFSANPISQKDYSITEEEFVYSMNYQSAAIARRAADISTTETGKKKYVIGSIGPTNKTLSISPSVENPAHREITFDELVNAYEVQINGLLDGDVDILLLETIFDTLNAKAAICAINNQLSRDKHRKHVGMPIFISGTITDKSGRFLSGQTCEAFYISVKHAKPMCIGLNCSLGAREMRPYIKMMGEYARGSYIICYPNAGLPNTMGEYDEKPRETAQFIAELAEEKLVNIVGGCCGTTPVHLQFIINSIQQIPPRKISDSSAYHGLSTLSGLEAMKFNREASNFVNIGERCNVCGCRDFRDHIKHGRIGEAVRMARDQVVNGAQILDLCFDDGLIDAEYFMCKFINIISTDPQIASVPFSIDSSNFNVVLSGLKSVQGKCIVNSISLKDGEGEFIRKAKIIKNFGAAVIVMAFDENGQATNCEDKLKICRRSHQILVDLLNFDRCDVIFDLNVLTVGTGIPEHRNYAVEYIRACAQVKREFPLCRTAGGVSNLSFSFRGLNRLRAAIHSAFLYHAVKAGMDMGIVNAGNLPNYDDIDAELLRHIENLIWNRGTDAVEELLKIGQQMELLVDGGGSEEKMEKWRLLPPDERLQFSLIKGIDDFAVSDTKECRDSNLYEDELQIIERVLMKAMKVVGDKFAEGKMFLPQVIKSARVMKKSVSYLVPFMKDSENKNSKHRSSGTIVLATVRGDVHDIGKNIVAVVLQCNNYDVIDLGIMTPWQTIVESALKHDADVIGLSGLITPSLEEMVTVAKEMKNAGMKIPLLIGGATTSRKHTAVKIQPYYQPTIHVQDASKSVIVCSSLLNEKTRNQYVDEVRNQYKEVRENYLNENENKKLLSYSEAKKLKPDYDWSKHVFTKPIFTGNLVMKDYDVTKVLPYIDWKPFFDVWQLRGRYPNRTYPKIFNDKFIGKEAKLLYDDAMKVLKDCIENKKLRLSAVVGFYPACSRDDDIIVYDVTNECDVVFHGLRQQAPSKSPRLCISDFVCPLKRNEDHVGMFVVTCHGGDVISRKFEGENDDYKSLLVKSLADRLVEAFAEKLHEEVRTKMWPYSPDEKLTSEELFKLKYQGIRPAFGYPTQPDHSEKSTMWRLLGAEEQIGSRLTWSFCMLPPSSISGLYLSHPDAAYFSVGKINRDQVLDYSKRKNKSLQEIEKLLSANLSYNPTS